LAKDKPVRRRRKVEKKKEGIIEPGIIAAYLNQLLPQNV